jgi:hypothetical protein
MLKTKPILGALINKIDAAHPMKKIEIGEYSEIKAPMMHFEISAFEAEGLGHVSVMSMNGMLGLMKMDTIIINPKSRDLPLLSYDRVYAMGKDTLIVELYETRKNPTELSAIRKVVKADALRLPVNDLGEHWYDHIKLPESISLKATKATSSEFDKVAEKMLTAYLETSADSEFDGAAKAEKSSAYVEGLLSNGGPSTSVFQKFFGEEKTAELFRTVLFGTQA